MNRKKCMSMLLCIVFLLVAASCSGTPQLTEQDKENCTATVRQFLDKYTALDGTASALLTSKLAGEDLKFEGFQRLLATPLQYEIGEITQNGETAVASIHISNIDFAAAFESVIAAVGENSTEEAILALLQQTLSASDCPRRDFTCTVPLIRDGEGWLIEMTPDLSNALLGGANEYLDNIVSEVSSNEE